MWPKAQEFGFPDEEAAFALQFGHGIGLAIWEKPVISRLVSLEHSHEIKPGMVFALETFWPATDGWSAARIEEEIVVTETGHEVITRFPAEKLLVAGAPYVTVDGPLETTREHDGPPSQRRGGNGRSQRQNRRNESVQVAASRAVQENIMAHSIVMPALEMAQETGKLLSWRKKEGEAIAKGEPLLDIETDKAVVEIESPADGILAGVKAQAGDVIPVGQTIAWIVNRARNLRRRSCLRLGPAHGQQACSRRRGRGEFSRCGIRCACIERPDFSEGAAAGARTWRRSLSRARDWRRRRNSG